MTAHEVDRGEDTGNAWSRGERVSVWLVLVVLILLAAVVSVGALAIRAMTQEPDPETAIDQITKWQQKVEADPTNVDLLVAMGYQYQQERQWAEAVETYDRALALDAENVGALYNRGVSLIPLSEVAEAERSYERVLALAPKHVLAAQALGSLYEQDSRYAEILQAVGPAAEANPEIADLHVLMGVAYERTNQPKNAARSYAQALRTMPDLQSAVDGLARVESAK